MDMIIQMNTAMVMDFRLLGDCTLQTINESTSLQGLTAAEEKKFSQTKKALRGHADCPCPQPLVTYRGVSREHLVKKLSSNTEGMDENTMLSYLFYFGDKAKHYYKHNNSGAKSMIWLTSIEDMSKETCEKIFKKITSVLKKKKNANITNFRAANPEFDPYFKAPDNHNSFVHILCELGPVARNYYLCFLHTVGNTGLGDMSVLVSTTTSYETATNFAGEVINSYVIWYVIPMPIHNYAVNASSLNSIEETLLKKGLPIIEKALYPEQMEYCVIGALFPSHILGVHIPKTSKFVVNPHLFNGANNACDMISSLKLDQEDFENRLEQTNYYRGVGTSFDGNFYTINSERREENTT